MGANGLEEAIVDDGQTRAASAVDRPWERFYGEKRFDPANLMADSLAGLVRDACAEHADRPAFSCVLPNGSAATLTFGEMDQLSDTIAAYLRGELGLPAGTVVAVQSPNCLAYPLVAYGVFKAGMVLTGVNPLYTTPEARHQLTDSQAEVLFAIDLFADRLAEVIEGTAVRHVVGLSVADFFPGPKRQILKGLMRLTGKLPRPTHPMTPLDDVLKEGRRWQAKLNVAGFASDRDIDDTAFYQYSGGTTGRSKGAEISHRNLLSNLTQTEVVNGGRMDRGRETAILVLPLYHIYALAIVAMASMRQGNHTVLVPSPRPLSNLKPVFEKFPPTQLPGINTLYQGLLAEDWFVRKPPQTLKWCFSGAAPLQKATADRWRELTGCTIHEGYGLTECTCVVTTSPLNDDYKPGTVGIPVPGTELRFVDENGTDVPRGQPGHILVRGPQVMKGYLNNPDATQGALLDGWLQTGDVGLMDEDGFVRIVDRQKDMIIVSGFNVFPAELEDVIARMPGVAEVAVVGAPDEETGERVYAFVVRQDPTLSADAVKAHCSSHLTNYKRPREVVFIDELPKSPVGKVLRRELRDRLSTADEPRPGRD